MDTKNDMRPQQCLDRNGEKEKNAITAFRMHFSSHCQMILIHAGVTLSELAVSCPIYLKFVHLALLGTFEKLHSLKCNLNYDTSEEEHAYLNLLRIQRILNNDKKLDMALNNFHEGFTQYLQRTMMNTGYEDSEAEENHVLFVSLFSKVLIIEAEKLLRYESALPTTTNYVNTNKRTHDKCTTSESTISPSKEIKLSEATVQLVRTTKRHYIYCVSNPDGMRAMKIIITNNPTIVGVENFNNELKIGSQLAYHGCRKSYTTTTYENKSALLLEWAHGYPLSNVKQLTAPNFFKVAREIVSCLLHMHSNRIRHLNLTSDHIIFNSETDSIKIVGFGSSSSFCSKRSYNPKLLERDLRYISPEQTGRVNREVDFRSDFYSLGIIFYKLLSGSYPFDSPNAIELIKMHIFQESSSLHDIENIPLPVSDMVSKLMEKDVDSRYQSAKGIMHDIDLIISEYKPGVKLVLAQHDISESFILPQKLYGRRDEYSKLLSAYNRIKSSSCFEIVFMTGDSGMGKTSLVMELNKHVIKDGTFICGKYDLTKSEPFSALIEAVKMLCDIISLEDEHAIAKYRSLIQDAVGEEGKLLTNIIDNLNSIIGKQPAIFESFGREAKDRFNYVFIKFITAIASVSCPLVIVLEDLQWIDIESLDLMTTLVESSIKNLMLIGVYRDNEIKDEHKVVDFLGSVEKLNVSRTEIKLYNMNHEHVNEFISDALCVPAIDSYLLTAFIYKKTKGNPFFMKQMLNALLEQNLIRFCPEQSNWKWDKRINKDKEIAENVLDLLRQKIHSLDKHTQRALMVASFLGSPFSLSSLKLIMNDKKSVEDALATGMVIEYNKCDMGCFVHDQVQHAAESLLPKDPKPLLLHVARKLWRRLPKADLDDNICAIANLLDRVKDMINENERVEVVELFLLAGEKMMTSLAPNKAFKYFKSGIELLDKTSWKTRYDLSLNIHCNAAKSAYCMAKYKIMREIIEKIFKNVTAALDLVPCYILLIRMNSDMRSFEEAIRHALNILEKLALTIDPNRSIRSELMQTKSLVEESVEDILEIRETEDKTVLSAMEILNYTLYSCYFSGNFNLFASVCSKMIELTMKHGVSKYSCYGLCSFALVLCNNGDKSSYDVGKLALKLLEKSNSKEMIPMVNSCFFCLISPYFASMHSSIVPMARTTCISLEIGSHHYSGSCAGGYSNFAFFCGEPLSKAIDELCQIEKVLIRRTPFHMAIHQAMLNLHDSDIINPAKLSGDKFDYKYCFDKAGAKGYIIRTSAICCIIAYLFYDYEAASEFLEICKRGKEYFGIAVLKVLLLFYDGLLASSMARNIERKEKYMKIVEENILKLKGYAENAPMNYLNKACLLEAELAVLHKNESQAKSLYQKAISLSKKYGFVNEEALACERFATFYIELESQPDATELLLQSYNCYKAWGAGSKMLHLIKVHPFLAAALKASTSTLEKSVENLKVNDDSAESVSVMTDDLSSTSTSTWQNQKRARLSITKCSDRQCDL